MDERQNTQCDFGTCKKCGNGDTYLQSGLCRGCVETRLDDSDLTERFWHLKYGENDAWWMVLIGSGLVGAIALMPWCVIAIILYWLCKQLL